MRSEVPGCRVRSGIVDRVLDLKMARVDPANALDHMQLVGGRQAGFVNPALAVESGSVDHKRVAIPAADRVAQPVGIVIFVMRPSVGENLTPDVRATFINDERESRNLND